MIRKHAKGFGRFDRPHGCGLKKAKRLINIYDLLGTE